MSNKSLGPLIWTPKETSEVKTILADASQLWFPKGFGFDPFSLEQIQFALTDPCILQFRLNKVRGRGILYGVRHAALRRKLANLYPPTERSWLWQKRLTHAGIWPYLTQHYAVQNMVISDIGMGHTVLHCHPPDAPDSGIVLKQEELPHHRLFCHILQALGWANIHSDHTIAQHLGWQITPFIPGETVSEWASLGHSPIHIPVLAKFAALGDLMGREDRHNENYILGPHGCLPIDTAALYGKHNESWLFKYVSGGLYEISTIAPHLWKNPHDQAPLKQFLTDYNECHDTLCAIPLSQLVSNIAAETSPLQSHGFIAERQTRAYRNNRSVHYKAALANMLHRMASRNLLDMIWETNPASLNAHPTLKMYALAHESRLATFFLAEERPWIFENLSAVAQAMGLGEILDTYRQHAQAVVDLTRLPAPL